MKFTTATFASLLSIVPALVSGALIPNADTPVFYLVATAPDAAGVTFDPIRLTGGTNGYATLNGGFPLSVPLAQALGGDPIAKFYFYHGALVAEDPAGKTSPNLFHPFIAANPGPKESCDTYGQLGFVQGSPSSPNKCAKFGNFQLSSDRMDAQLGAKLEVDSIGSFYTCEGGASIYYKLNADDGPKGCTPVQLYTLPVVE